MATTAAAAAATDTTTTSATTRRRGRRRESRPPGLQTASGATQLLLVAFLINILLGIKQSDALMNLPDGIENILGFVPKSSFKCERDGYFGDIENDCRLFHLCQRQVLGNGRTEWRHWTYACGNQTMFNQLTLTCAFVDEAIPCRHASQFQYLNEVIHRPAEPFLTDADVTSGFSYYSNRVMSDGARARAFQDSQLMAQIGGQQQPQQPRADFGFQSDRQPSNNLAAAELPPPPQSVAQVGGNLIVSHSLQLRHEQQAAAPRQQQQLQGAARAQQPARQLQRQQSAPVGQRAPVSSSASNFFASADAARSSNAAPQFAQTPQPQTQTAAQVQPNAFVASPQDQPNTFSFSIATDHNSASGAQQFFGLPQLGEQTSARLQNRVVELQTVAPQTDAPLFFQGVLPNSQFGPLPPPPPPSAPLSQTLSPATRPLAQTTTPATETTTFVAASQPLVQTSTFGPLVAVTQLQAQQPTATATTTTTSSATRTVATAADATTTLAPQPQAAQVTTSAPTEAQRRALRQQVRQQMQLGAARRPPQTGNAARRHNLERAHVAFQSTRLSAGRQQEPRAATTQTPLVMRRSLPAAGQQQPVPSGDKFNWQQLGHDFWRRPFELQPPQFESLLMRRT